VYFILRKLCYIASCHHGIARPRDVDAEDGLQIWRGAANTE